MLLWLILSSAYYIQYSIKGEPHIHSASGSLANLISYLKGQGILLKKGTSFFIDLTKFSGLSCPRFKSINSVVDPKESPYDADEASSFQ